MGDKMNNPPLFFTLAQLRFNPFSKLNEVIDDIQEAFRLAHFPDFRQERIHIVNFQGGATNPSQQSRYVFGNTEGTANFILDNGSLIYQTTDYETFTEFSEMFKLGITTFNDHVPDGLDYVSRLGIRYFDVVQPPTPKTLDQYLIKEVLGLSEKVPKLTHSFSETRSSSKHGSLLTKVIIRDGTLNLPPEIAPIAPKINQKFEMYTGRHAVIDSDAFNDKRQDFDVEAIIENLIGLHQDIDHTFKQMVTPYALKSWK